MILTILVFLAILTVLVLVHELGHFLVAKWIGVRVEEFGMGIPPRIFGKKIGETIYSLNWLPIGGFVRLAGEDEDPTNAKGVTQKNVSRMFWARSKKERSAILVAGVFMNFALAVIITMFLLTNGVLEPSGKVRIQNVMDASPAAVVGLASGDVVEKVSIKEENGTMVEQTITVPADLIAFSKEHGGKEVVVSIDRDGTKQDIKVTPRKDPEPGKGALGIGISDLEMRTYTWSEAPQKALMINIMRVWEMLKALGVMVWHIITLQLPKMDVAGPVGIAQVVGESIKFGWKAVFEIASIISLNLAVFNLLPIPALDGGRFAFVIFEKLRGKRVHPAFEQSTHQIGMLILLGLIALVSINDILRLIPR